MSNFKSVTQNLSVPDWNQIPPLSVTGRVYRSSNAEVVAETSAGELRISLHEFGARLRFGKAECGDYEILADAEPEAHALTLDTEDKESNISAGDFSLQLMHQPLSFVFKSGDKLIQKSPTDAHFVRRFRLPPVARVDEGWFISLELDSSEPVYGLGEKWGKLDKRGQLIRSYNQDALGVNAEASYKNSPFCWSPQGWGVFVHTPAPVTHSVGYAPWSQRAYGLLVEDSSADIFLFANQQGADIIKSFTELTGRAPVPPLWAAGAIISKAYYQDGDELLQAARTVRQQEMPCDVITLDGRAWQDTRTRFAFEWDPARYKDPASIINELKALNFKICVWEYPLISIHNPLFDELSQKGWLIKHRETGETYVYKWDESAFDDVLTPLPDSGILDFTHPEAYAFWRDSHKPLFDLGVDMIKADFGEQLEPDMLACSGDSGHTLHNAYTLLYNRCVYEAAERYCKTGPFLFSRSAWTGSQRYPSQWGGDPQADWGGMAGSLRGALSWGMSGAPYYATDIGGFYADQRDEELFARWVQMGVFSAHMRLHGIGQREPWSYADRPMGAAAEAAATAALKLRYRLLPYLRQLMQQASQTGMPVQRAMALSFPEERAAWAFEDQFMFGDQMLVAPCLRPGGLVEVYLPKGRWRLFLRDEVFEGGCVHQMNLPLDQMAVFIKEGYKIPLGPEIQHTEQLEGSDQIECYWPDE